MNQIQTPDHSPGAIDFRSQIRSAIGAVLPDLTQELSRFPSGFQYDVNAPKITLGSAEEYAQAMGRDLGSVGRKILENFGGELSVEPRLGVMNVVGDPTGELEIEYRSLTGGRQFALAIKGDDLSLTGDATEEEITQALDMIFKAGKINRDPNEVHITTIRNLNYYDRSGNPIKKEKE
ncbi:hypothetical protein A3C98_02870 [Candidatus Roizmanbacteria bacterium RIFCSPHIGHO2_02_FULL_37_15]|nr:MAG: hypothetical protein A3C98_02870 [Candidatus Roizmanbacteria bacterium RIFCSPHIGHO2_02_FULL_37_15]OGK33179.1 MAG: hypothetical protein A3F57_01195 [Candidatus Roizmanbacteria bacterium RIFCSPHIGHO2_12_FULL_36_11]